MTALKSLFRGIGWRIFFSFTTLLFVLIGVLSVATWTYLERTAYDTAANELRVQSISLAQQLERDFVRLESGIRILGADNGRIDDLVSGPKPNSSRLKAYLKIRLAQQPLFEHFYIFNTYGEIIAKTDPEWPIQNVQREKFLQLGLRKVTFSDIFEDPNYAALVLLVSGPIGDPKFPVGVLVGKVNLDHLYALMDQKLGLVGTLDAFLVDSQLHFVTPAKTAPKDEVRQSHLVATQLKDHLAEEFWVGKYQNYKGEEVLGTVIKTKVYSGFLVVEKGFIEVERHLQFIKRTIVSSVAFLLVALTFTTILITRSVTKPVQSLVDSARRIASGDMSSAILDPEGSDEFSFLAQEFDKMRLRLADYQSQLKQRLVISEQKRQDSERLAAIGTLAASLAHEIRNPLNGMSLLISHLERSGERSDAERKTIGGMRSEIARLDRLVTDILDYSRPLKLQKQPLELIQLINEIIEFYKPIFSKQVVKVSLMLPDPPEAIILADHDKVRQAIINVIQNAFDAVNQIEGDKKILISITKSTDPEISESQCVEIVVTDNGPGISDQNRARLFDLFFSTKEKGTGLGLTVVRKIMDAHGGLVRVEGQDKDTRCGTSISLIFPTV